MALAIIKIANKKWNDDGADTATMLQLDMRSQGCLQEHQRDKNCNIKRRHM